MVAEVIVDISNSEVDKVFDYSIGDRQVLRGHRVLVPFGRMTVEGFVINLKETSEYAKGLKEIAEILDPYPVVSDELLQLMDFMTHAYHLRKADVLRLFIPAEMRGGRVKELVVKSARLRDEYRNADPLSFIKKSATAQMELFYYLCENDWLNVSDLNATMSASALRNLIARDIVEVKEGEVFRTPYVGDVASDKNNIVLTKDQQAVSAEILRGENKVFLLHGVTGSGKTEVYMDGIKKVLASGKTAIMLVPEISLTPQVLREFRVKFGGAVALLHSGLSAGERFDEWRRLLTGEASVALGARSAIFAPIKNLALIIIDEEHDGSYISESNPRYNTIEVAKKRAELNGANLVLGSATPSIESYYNAKSGDYKLLELNERINKRELPKIEVVNMCNELYDGNNGVFSRLMVDALTECINNGNQCIIFINRRGYSSYMMCRSCGYVAKCVDCDVSLVYHKEDNALKCHYCGNRYAVLTECPNCHSEHIKRGYIGTQQIAEKLEEMFKGVKVFRMDNDTTRTKDAHAKILSDFSKAGSAILVGTQMIAKGHDFPDVTLVGIVDADMSLHFSDFRASERTYQLITQVSGRAGRDKKTGRVVLQTYSPNNYVYRFAIKNNYKGFYEKEVNLREVTKYPPFSKIVRILVSSESEESAGQVLKGIFDELSEVYNKRRNDISYFAAMKAPVKRVKRYFRVQIIMRIVNDFDNLIQKVYNTVDKYVISKVNCFVEINPNNLY